MKTVKFCLLAMAIIIGLTGAGECKSLDEYIREAEASKNSGNLLQAEKIMEQALEEYPDNATVYAYLGGYIGMQAGQFSDLAKVVMLSTRSIELLDRAVSLDSRNISARFYRGLMSVMVPESFGKLDQGIKDLELIISVHDQSQGVVPNDVLIAAVDNLGTGYSKKGDLLKAKNAWKRITELVPGTQFASQAENKIKNLNTSETKPIKTVTAIANEVPQIHALKEKRGKDPNNLDLLIELSKAFSIEAAKGYDERTYVNPGFRTYLAVELTNLMNKIVALAPENIELRLARGEAYIEMPFFVYRLDQGIKDMNMVIESDVPDSLKARALYLLGLAYQKKAATSWIEVISKYPKTEAAMMTFNEISPSVKRFNISEHRTPVVVIDFVLAFRDELAPQTAVWIEDGNGNFVKTVYVSGFSGHAREKQINLGTWSKSSEFIDTDGVTGASIDLGHHIYVWDMKDFSGKKVKHGEYKINVETFYWPSMKYQIVSAKLRLGKKESSKIVKEGDFIPYLEIKYIP